MINPDRVKEIAIGIIIAAIVLFFILVLAAATGLAILWFLADMLLVFIIATEIAGRKKCS